MDEEIESLIVRVRADTKGFDRDVAALRGSLSAVLGEGAARAGATIERGLLGALGRGRIGFEELRRVALDALGDIAAAALGSGLSALGGGGGGGVAGVGASLGTLFGSFLGLPGRATGGPVAPGRGYVVGERGPEIFVPTSSGRIEPGRGGGPALVRVTVNVSDAGGSAPRALERSSRQVARAVGRAIAGAQD